MSLAERAPWVISVAPLRRASICASQGFDVTVSAGGLRDDGAAVAVSDEDLGARNAVDDAADRVGVEGQPAQRVRGGDDRVARAAQPVGQSGPARGVGEGAMYENDRRLFNMVGSPV
jgi:hypothetical protein